MKWVGIYFVGYTILIVGLVAAMYKAGVIERIGWSWVGIGLIIALGIGVIIAVRVGAPKRSSVEIDRN
ncbi:MAG TPA: hypothetical protein VFV75_06665 [Candidatus Polarisedimenticolaceae bacterium]|nr:hypothetical protein [Candidatus Polarisedimenticolaceae bacterium]